MPAAAWWKPALVLAVDLGWSWVLQSWGRPWFVALFPTATGEANRFLDQQLIPMLWISYGVMLIGQISWLAWLARLLRERPPTDDPQRLRGRMRRRWCQWVAVLLVISVLLHGSLAWQMRSPAQPTALVFVVGLLLCDLLVIFWFPTAVMTPAEQRSAIPALHVVQQYWARMNGEC